MMDQSAQGISDLSDRMKLSASTQSAVLNVLYDNLQRTIVECIAKGASLILSVSDDDPHIQSLAGRAVVNIPGDVQVVKLSQDLRDILMNREVYLTPTPTLLASGNARVAPESGLEMETIEFQKETKTLKPPDPGKGIWKCTCVYCSDSFPRTCPTFIKAQEEKAKAKATEVKKKRPYKPDLKRAQRAPCKICGQIVRNGSLKFHLQAHEGITYPCRSCLKNFQTPFTRARHEKEVHAINRTKDVQCPHCPKQFYTQAALNVHSNQTHKGMYRFFCDICGKGWYFANQVKEHRKVHTGEQPHVCQICYRGFRVKHGLTLHMKQHDPDRKGKGTRQKKERKK